MFSFVLNLLVLSLIFSLACGAAFLLRKTLLRGREGIMYPIWTAILIISILPLGINFPTPTAKAIEYTQTDDVFDNETQAVENTASIISDSNNSTNELSAVSETKSTDHFTYRLRRAMASCVGYINEISIALFAVWIGGFLIVFVRALCKYTNSKKLMLTNSEACDDERILSIINELRLAMKIKRKVKLRIFNAESFMSPCICGFVFPTLYIEPGCLSMSDNELKCILTHELTHMRRFDMVIKLFSLFATSVHWFNPAAKKVRETALEDCELSCDYNVIKLFGTDASSMYMGTILDFTERYSKHCKLVFRDGMSCGLFASEPSGAAFMKMRYANMKNYRGGKLMLLLASVFAASCIAVNIFALSCSSAVTLSTFGSAIKLSPAFDIMLRAYYDLDSEDYITPEMVDGIKSISVSISREYDDRMLVEFTVNSDSRITRPLPQVAQANYTENLMFAALWEHGASNPVTDKNGNPIYNLEHYNHFKAYYVLTDTSTIEENAAAFESCYVLDSNSSERELDILHDTLGEVGLLDAWTITSTEFDVSSLGYFTNLEEIEFIGLIPVGYEFPDNVRVIVSSTDAVFPNQTDIARDIATVT